MFANTVDEKAAVLTAGGIDTDGADESKVQRWYDRYIKTLAREVLFPIFAASKGTTQWAVRNLIAALVNAELPTVRKGKATADRTTTVLTTEAIANLYENREADAQNIAKAYLRGVEALHQCFTNSVESSRGNKMSQVVLHGFGIKTTAAENAKDALADLRDMPALPRDDQGKIKQELADFVLAAAGQ